MEISRIAVIGAGTMGTKISHRCIVSGLETMLYDKFPDALQRAVAQIEDWLKERIQQGHMTAEQTQAARAKLHPCDGLAECVGAADLIIETVPENLELKRGVLAEIDELLPSKAYVCTNSSSLPCSKIAGSLSRPERFFNINFSMPQEPTDKLVELMRGAQTADEAMVAGEKFVRMLDMVPIVTYREIMGFSFNRVWRAIKREVLHLVDQGYSDYQDIDRAWMMEFGTPFGPFGLMDIIGLDVVRDIEKQYYLDSGEERDRPPGLLDDMISQGKLGVKSGQGFYKHPNPAYKEKEWLHKQGKYDEDIKTKLQII
ncbi:MAG: 3-hydroxyacyl-CoA dehydrogenase family protein [Desulfobacterales bacterium]|nr:MAG: 3-hydroxyacyl-CoA dehydrogenase family protein [Desulfobacterales bacterium]